MRRERLYLLIAMLALLTFSPAARQKSKDLSPEVIGKIEAQITQEMERLKIPALSIAIAANNKLQYAKGFGKADVENSVPAKETTVYRTASIAKAMTATAVINERYE